MKEKIEGIDTVQIGSTLWWKNNYANRPAWKSAQVTAETRVSWIIKPYGRMQKINKKTLIETNGNGIGYGNLQYFASESQVEQLIWLGHNSCRVKRCVLDCNDPVKLQQIDAIFTAVSDKDQV